MKFIIIFVMFLISCVKADNITSVTSSYHNYQVNSNNVDNSTWFSNNSFSLISIKNDYKKYMAGESLIYINGNYDMDTYMNRKELVLKVGVYESIYLMLGRGKYNQKSTDYDDTGYYIEGPTVEGEYTVMGLSYHVLFPEIDSLLAIEWYESKFDKVSNSEYIAEEYSMDTSYKENSIKASELDNSMFMLRFSYYLKGGHTGMSIGYGIDNSGIVMSFGITLRYF